MALQLQPTDRAPVREWQPGRPRASAAALLAGLPRLVPAALLLALSGRLLALGVDALALRLLHPLNFSAYLLVMVSAELLLAVFALAAPLAAIRGLSPDIVRGDALRAVRTTLAVRRLWSSVQWGVAVLLLAVFLVVGLVWGLQRALLGAFVLIFGLFAVVGRLQIEAALVAGLLRPCSAIYVASLLPAGVTLLGLFLLAWSTVSFAPVTVVTAHICGALAGLAAARAILALRGPVAAVPACLASSDPVPRRALCAWTVASLAERAVPVAPPLGVLALSEPRVAVAYAMAWRVSGVVDAGVLVHALVRPAVAAGAPAGFTAAPGSVVRPAIEAASLALSWTLVPAVLAAGALVAAELQVACWGFRRPRSEPSCASSLRAVCLLSRPVPVPSFSRSVDTTVLAVASLLRSVFRLFLLASSLRLSATCTPLPLSSLSRVQRSSSPSPGWLGPGSVSTALSSTWSVVPPRSDPFLASHFGSQCFVPPFEYFCRGGVRPAGDPPALPLARHFCSCRIALPAR